MSGITAAFHAYGTDPTQARRMFRGLATSAHPDPRAQAAYALMMSLGQGGGRDLASAVSFYERAANQGHAVACYSLAALLAEGRGCARDLARSLHWYHRAAELGDRDALHVMGTICAGGVGVAADPAVALAWWRLAAVRGHAAAMSCIGRAYETGEGVAAEPATAAMWYLDAATAGDESAQVELARLLPQVLAEAETGPAAASFVAASFASRQDPAEGVRLLERACALGHGRSCYQLAEKVRQGELPGGAERSVELLQQGASAGDEEAQHDLANAYRTGTGVAMDLDQAVVWYHQAASAGRPSSLTALGAALLSRATSEDERAGALDALRRAALAGHAPGMYLCGIHLAETDQIEALRWLLEAASIGHDEALVAAGQLAAALTPEEVRSADRLTQTDGAVAEALLAER